MTHARPDGNAWSTLHETAVASVVPSVGSIRLSGPDRVAFLHGIVAQDVRSLPEGGATRSVILDVKGHALHELAIHRRADDVHLAVEDGAAGDVLALLERQRIFDDVTIGDHRDVLRTITVQGPHALAVAREAFGAGASPGVFAAASVADAAVLVVPSRRSRPAGVDVFALSKHVNLVREALTASGARWFDERIDAALEASRIEAGIARAGTEAGPGVLPQEANLTDYLSTTKGCYVGQEIMARLEARATVKRRLVQLRFAARARDALAPGTPIEHAGRTVGRLGATAMHPMLGFVGLAVLHRAHSDTIDVAGHQAAIVQV